MAMAPKAIEEAEKNQAALTKSLTDFLGQQDELRPKVSDKDSFDKLIQVVKASTSANESVAQFEIRVKALGATVETLARTLRVLP